VAELDLNFRRGTEDDKGNLLGLVSGYTTTDGQTRDMADVWFAKDLPPPDAADLLAGPPTPLAGAEGSVAAGTTSAAAAAGLVPGAAVASAPRLRGLFDDELRPDVLL
jgi:hypothetical protein